MKKRQNTKQKNQDNTRMTIYHPKIKGLVEEAFKANGVQYYCFKQESEGRYKRYIVMQAFLQEYYLRIDLATLKANIQQLDKWLNPPISKEGVGQLQLGRALELLDVMRQRAEIAFEPDTVYRLASCLYFDDTEDVSNYDKDHNEKKIASWKEANIVDFFFHRLFKELTGLTVSSRTDLANYLQEVPNLLGSLRSMEDILTR